MYGYSCPKVFSSISALGYTPPGAKSALSSLIDSLEIHEETRKILLWEISEKNNDNLKKLSLERELLGEELFQISDPLFEHSNIDLRACFSLLLAGVYYLSLHSNSTGGEFCSVDLKDEYGRSRIKKSLSDMIELIFSVPKQE